MKILLDGKDLIDIAEHSKPISLSDLGDFLRHNSAQLVLSYTNVRELAAPVVTTGEILKIRKILNTVEALPVCYIREGFIIDDELRAALRAFETGTEYTEIDPFVRRWDYTFHHGESPAKNYVGYSIFEIIYTVSKREPSFLLHPTYLADRLRKQFEFERQMPRGVKKSVVANFPDSINRQLKARGIPEPSKGSMNFGKWIHSIPLRCPGLRLSYEMFHAMQANLTDIPKNSDIPDLAYIPALPFVDYLTLDRRMHSYAVQVSRQLTKINSAVNYEKRLFRSVKELLDTF